MVERMGWLNMTEIKLKIDDYGYVYAEMPDGTIYQLLADLFDNPYYGKIKLGKEVEVEENEDSER